MIESTTEASGKLDRACSAGQTVGFSLFEKFGRVLVSRGIENKESSGRGPWIRAPSLQYPTPLMIALRRFTIGTIILVWLI